MFGTRYPIVLAPMAGGTSTPQLAAAVSNAGGLGSLGAAYLTPVQIAEEIAQVRRATDRPFAVNLFTGGGDGSVASDRDAAPMLGLLAEYHRELGLPAPVLPARAGEALDEQLAAVLEARVPVFSFTFGTPEVRWLDAFRQSGIKLVGTATTVEEAVALEAAGVDAVAAQGEEAGGHRGTFVGSFEEAMVPTLELVRGCARAVRVPVVAAGGIMDGAGIREALEAGAAGVQLGTAFIGCPESGAAPAFKAAVLGATGDETRVTRAFSGRHARGIRNRVMDEIDARAEAILPYPWQNAATRGMRTAAGKAGRAEFLSLWAGRNVRLAREMPAGELVRVLAREAGFD
jgi:nitronate monooxygenase